MMKWKKLVVMMLKKEQHVLKLKHRPKVAVVEEADVADAEQQVVALVQVVVKDAAHQVVPQVVVRVVAGDNPGEPKPIDHIIY